MYTEIHLSEFDIRKIVAEKFNADMDDVTARYFMETVGYGTSERQEPCVKVIIKTEKGG